MCICVCACEGEDAPCAPEPHGCWWRLIRDLIINKKIVIARRASCRASRARADPSLLFSYFFLARARRTGGWGACGRGRRGNRSGAARSPRAVSAQRPLGSRSDGADRAFKSCSARARRWRGHACWIYMCVCACASSSSCTRRRWHWMPVASLRRSSLLSQSVIHLFFLIYSSFLSAYGRGDGGGSPSLTLVETQRVRTQLAVGVGGSECAAHAVAWLSLRRERTGGRRAF